MRLSIGLDLRQQLEMRLTPQLILQMQLLQVSALDLEQMVREEMEKNPALEESDGSPGTVEADVIASISEPPPEAAAPVPAENAPAPETAVTRLIRALEHLRLYQPPLRVTPEVQAYYAALAAAQTGERRERYKDLRAALADEDFRRSFLQDPHDAALVHDTITPTVLQGSPKTNVIPSTASAELDCRLLPGEDPQAFVRTITDVIADPDVKVSVLLNFSASSSPIDAASYAAVRRLAERDGVPVVPSVLTGFTDSHYFREKGIASYGFIPFDLSEDERRREHGVNERVSTLNLRQGTQRLIELLRILDVETQDHGQTQHDAN